MINILNSWKTHFLFTWWNDCDVITHYHTLYKSTQQNAFRHLINLLSPHKSYTLHQKTEYATAERITLRGQDAH